jgi:hypothetical protein
MESDMGHGSGGATGGVGIKVGNMVSPAARSFDGGKIADMFFYQRLSMPSAMVRNHAR